jgi:N-acetylmuramoyl-L-alanine amidase
VETYYGPPSAARLAQRLQSAMLRVQNSENRGAKQHGFYVLRKTRIPCVLIEPDFLTNPEEGQRVLQTAYRQRLADQIAQAILSTRAN